MSENGITRPYIERMAIYMEGRLLNFSNKMADTCYLFDYNYNRKGETFRSL